MTRVFFLPTGGWGGAAVARALWGGEDELFMDVELCIDGAQPQSEDGLPGYLLAPGSSSPPVSSNAGGSSRDVGGRKAGGCFPLDYDAALDAAAELRLEIEREKERATEGERKGEMLR